MKNPILLLLVTVLMAGILPAASLATETVETDRYEAEDANVSHANLYDSSYASNGSYVGFINYQDSYVEFDVNVAEQGEYNVVIGYANGTGNDSTHALSVNGEYYRTVQYPPTKGWSSSSPESIQTITSSLPLEAGNNKVRLSKGIGYAELDYITLTKSSETVQVQSIEIFTQGNQTEISPNSKLEMTAIVGPQTATNAKVSWSVKNADGSETDAASINEYGVLTAIKDGRVKVIATAKDGSGIQDSTLVSIEGNQLIVDLANKYRPVTHMASGSLYGLAEEGRPSDNLIGPTEPFMFTQMAPNGGQLPNGEDSPTGDALEVAPIAERNGAKVTIRMPDIYPNFPYQWEGWNDWLDKVEEMVTATKQSGVTNIYAYEIWNEPNWTWNTGEAGPFTEGWERTYDKIKKLDSETKIMGPSISLYDEKYLEQFLTYCRDHNCLPDIISWHELGDPEGNHVNGPAPWTIKSHVESYRQLEKRLGISPIPISINEYGVQTEEGVPGNMVQYIAQFERTGVESANAAFWFRPGRLSNIITESREPNGGWWLYKWYGDMSGEMAMTVPAHTMSMGLDGIASIDSESKVVKAVFGGASGDSTITVKGFDSTQFLSETVHVKVQAAPWYGVDTPVQEPFTLFEGEFDITNNQINVPITGMNKSWGYNLTITRSGEKVDRYEAEDTNVDQAQIFSATPYVSNSSYARLNDADENVEFNVNVPKDGEYALKIRYANGTDKEVKHGLLVNGSYTGEVSYPATGGWISENLAATVNTSIHLSAGRNSITLSHGITDGFVELDFLQINPEPVGHFEVRAEAEEANFHDASISKSGYASSGRYVGSINNSDSYVEFEVQVPTTGGYTMEIGYANGASEESTHSLSINGGSSSVVTFAPSGGWINAVPNMGTRNLIEETVHLNKGNNTIRFTNGEGYAELDYIKLTKIVTLDFLIESVEYFTEKGWIKKKGIANSLKAKLNNGKLKSFINQVEAQRGKHVSRAAADSLITDAEYLLSK